MGLLRYLLAVALVCNASPSVAETMRDAFLDAIDFNPGLRSVQERVRGAEAQVDAAKAGNWPTISVNSSEGLSYLDTNTQTTTLAATRQALVVRQPLISGGQVKGDIQRTKANLQAERARLLEVEQTLLTTVAQAYCTVFRDRALLELATSNERRLRQELDQARIRFRFGDVTTTDIAQAETRLAGAAHGLAIAQANVAESEADFQRAVGRVPDKVLLAPKEAPALPRSLDEALGLAQDHPALKAAASDVESARGALEIAKSSRRPKLAIESQLAYATDPDRYTDRQTEASIGAVISVPLYQGGGAAARERAAQSDLARRRYDLDDRLLEISKTVTQAWQAYAVAQSSIRALGIQSRAAGIAADGVRQEALLGLRTVLDVLDAENELYAAKAESVRAQMDVVVASYALRAATGHLTESALGLSEGDNAAR